MATILAPYECRPERLHPSLSQHVTHKDHIEMFGTQYEFCVIDGIAVPQVPNFVGMPAGQDLFISSEVPEQFVPVWLQHELLCQRLRTGKTGRCANIEEWDVVNATRRNLQDELILTRHALYEALLVFNKIDLDHPQPTTELGHEMLGTYRYLTEEGHRRKILSS